MKFRVDELRIEIEKQRNEHLKDFNEAVDAYRDAALKEITRWAERIRSGARFRVVSSLPIPEEHTKDYDNILAMLSMTTDKEIELLEHEFQRYVRGEWEWMQSFAANTLSYKGRR